MATGRDDIIVMTERNNPFDFERSLREYLEKYVKECSCEPYYRAVLDSGSCVWYVYVGNETEDARIPIGSIEEQTGISYVYRLLHEKFGPTLLDMLLAVGKGHKDKGFAKRAVFRYQPVASSGEKIRDATQWDKLMGDLVQPEVGMVLDGYYDEAYIPDRYTKTKTIEVVIHDYIVVRSDEGMVFLVDTDEWGGKIPQEWICGETP